MNSESDFEQQTRERDFGMRVVLVGVAIFSGSHFLAASSFPWTELLLLTLVCLYGEWRSVKLPGYGFLNPGEGFYLATACLYGPLPGGLLAFLLGVLGDLRKQKRAGVVLFNMGWALATFSLAAVAYQGFGLVGAGLAYVLVAGVLQAHGERIFSGLELRETYRHQGKEMLLVAPAVFLFAYLTMVLFALRPVAILLLLLPLELLVTYVHTRELSQELQQTLKELELAQAELVATGRKAALGVMAAGIAHEINNPLAAAVTNVHMLKMMTREKAAKPSLDLLDKSIARCQSIVGRMLKYSREGQAGGVPCDLEETVADAVLFCGRKFGQGGVTLSIELDEVGSVLGDPTELVQIVSNLISNAHDAESSLVEVTASLEGEWVSLQVSDDGVGIPEDKAVQIFEPFFTTKAVGSGTGLGLSIAQGLARGMGGDLKLLQSQPGRTEFELKLRAV